MLDMRHPHRNGPIEAGQEGEGYVRNGHSARGDRTREQLLDALETLVAEKGFAPLSHRAIARAAGVHAALLHYHFGTVERIVEETVARKASRLAQSQLAALLQVTRQPRFDVVDVVRALWAPFVDIGAGSDVPWRNYLCLIARLSSHPGGDALTARYFSEVAEAARKAIRVVRPNAPDEAIRAGLRHTRALFEREVQATLCKAPGTPADHARMIEFAAAGFDHLLGAHKARAPALAAD
jgi:AcrR family transcriptional regulator